ncbi:FAD-dependent oxidoreductase, partial [Proteus terrae]
MHDNYDVLIIGGGPGGYVAAIRAGQLGLRTALVEKQHLGGICLNWGCIPTKALLHGAEVAHSITHASQLGISVGEVNVDLQKLVQFSRAVSQQLTGGVEYLLKKNGVRVIDGTARLRGKGQITVADARGEAHDYRADHVILATGARPRALPGIEPDGEHIWTYFEALQPKRLPRSLLIIGSGAIGVEFASLYNDLGCKVTLVELASQILPVEDAEVSAAVRKSFEK